jgi:hypothetical protein
LRSAILKSCRRRSRNVDVTGSHCRRRTRFAKREIKQFREYLGRLEGLRRGAGTGFGDRR